MFKNEMVFFDGSPEYQGFKNMFKDSDVITEFLESEKSNDGTLELIYKEKEAAERRTQCIVAVAKEFEKISNNVD